MTFRPIFAQIALTVALISSGTNAQAQASFTDTDWNTEFYASCDFPTPIGDTKSVAWTGKGGDRKLLFTLQKGQIGTCSTDAQPRHSAPYWERAELSQSNRMQLGQVNTIEFEATFLKGFRGERESFFQIHNWSQSCNASPPLMMKIHKGKLQILTLKGTKVKDGIITKQGAHRSVYRKSIKIGALMNKPSNFRIVFDAKGRGRGKVSVHLNGKQLVKNARIDFATCALPYAKIGIYRPGGAARTSQIAFDNLKLTRH